MKIAQRAADLHNDRHELVSFLHDNLSNEFSLARFDWLYVNCPFGEARAWIATDAHSGRTIGAAAAFPRHFRIEGTMRRVWVLGDFCISKEARSLGPAVQLQRVCLKSLNDEPWYDFPSQSMVAIYKRIGAFEFAEQVRYAKLLRIDQKVEAWVSGHSVANAVRYAGNAFLRLRSRATVARDLELSVLSGTFTDEFDNLNDRIRTVQVQGIRTSEFLNWRYRHHPTQKSIVIVARRRAELWGYAVLTLNDGNGVICDLNAVEEESTLPALIAFSECALRQDGAYTISAHINNGSRLHGYFRSAGFYARERSPMVIHGAPAPLTNWLIQPADRDS